MGLEGKVCVITGGGSGIGKSAALMMSSGGAKIILVGRTMSKLVDVQKQIEEENGEVFSLTADVGDEKSVQELIAAIGRQYDRVDVLVNNAFNERRKPFGDITKDEWNEGMNSILTHQFTCTQRRSAGRRGHAFCAQMTHMRI